jgi:hypothetical protein
MPRHAYFRTRDSECGQFLSASLWDDQNGTPLSVMSAFARLGLEPWVEAVRLAEMSRRTAVKTLVANLSQLPFSGTDSPDYANIAARLVKLLPEREAENISQSVRPIRISIDWIVAVLLGAAIVLQMNGYL